LPHPAVAALRFAILLPRTDAVVVAQVELAATVAALRGSVVLVLAALQALAEVPTVAPAILNVENLNSVNSKTTPADLLRS